ncbi:universal stress protein [uncultured Paludibaculum sp.]|uniref:universal stress protein n=1 Tax=uncultured Paludibaculum sp. TaxID=1765020 RepID=UPI002AAB3147|nr:universal stress protein [uncultured Paludibaculum sp.]
MPAPAFDLIVCPIDFSDCSANALRWAAWLATSLGKPLRLIHAVHVDMPSYVPAIQRQDILDQWTQVREQAESHLRDWASRNLPAGLSVQYEVSDAPPVEAIIAAAHRGNACVVMGTHGRTGWRQVWMGSVTTRTIEQAKVPVLAIPPDKSVC